MVALWHDLRYGLRQLRIKPGFTIVAVLALGLGIGACTAVFSVANAVLFSPLPYAEPDRLVTFGRWKDERTWDPFFSTETFNALSQQRCVEATTGFRYTRCHITGGEYAEQVQGDLVSPNVFDVLSIKPHLGRTFRPDEGRPGRDNVIVISHHLWQRRFGGDPNFIGKTIPLFHLYSGNDLEQERLYTVVGIMPPGLREYFDYGNIDIWQPIDVRQWNNQVGLSVISRLKPGVTLAQTQTQADGLTELLAGQASEAEAQKPICVRSLRAQYERRGMRRSWGMLAGAAMFILLIACANVANMLLTRAIGREKEVAMRTILGAGRIRLIRQLLTEGLLLSALGAGLGTLLACWGIDLLSPLIPADLVPLCSNIKLSWPMLGCTCFFLVVTGIGFGLAPALQLGRPNLMGAVKENGTRSQNTSNRRPLRSALVVTQVALSLVLLIGAGLMIRTMREILQENVGYDPANLVQFEIDLPYGDDRSYDKEAQRTLFFDNALERIASIAGVRSVGVIGDSIKKCQSSEQTELKSVTIYPISTRPHDYLDTLSVQLLRGRRFTEQEEIGQENCILVDEIMARKLWPTTDPLGQILTVQLRRPTQRRPDPMPEDCRVVGIVRSMRFWGYTDQPQGAVYIPWKAWNNMRYVGTSSQGKFVVRSTSNPSVLIPAIRQTIGSLDGRLPIFKVVRLEDRLRESTTQERIYLKLLTAVGLLGLVLATVGLYGVISYSVTQRTHEIGVRVALGAGHDDVLRLILKKGLMLIAIGLTVGLGGALAMTRILSSTLYGVTATDPWTFIAVGILLAIVGLIACYIPARNAARIDPMTALRYE